MTLTGTTGRKKDKPAVKRKYGGGAHGVQRPDPMSLLAWYDRHRRRLPWRALPGESADPYRVWLSEVMLQQTTVTAVAPRFLAWTARWPDFASLAAADEAE